VDRGGLEGPDVGGHADEREDEDDGDEDHG
jgi:hypothetical protein